MRVYKRDGRMSHPYYKIWKKMISRCEHRSNPAYHRYGAKNISVCQSWRDNFWQFVEDMGEKPCPTYTIDRIDNLKGYSKSNCRWASKRTQSRNRNVSTANIWRNTQIQEGWVGCLQIQGKRLYTPTHPNIEQVEIDLAQLELLYKEFL